jgi:hypothetical protein
MRQQGRDFFPIRTESAGNLVFPERKNLLRFTEDREKKNGEK